MYRQLDILAKLQRYSTYRAHRDRPTISLKTLWATGQQRHLWRLQSGRVPKCRALVVGIP